MKRNEYKAKKGTVKIGRKTITVGDKWQTPSGEVLTVISIGAIPEHEWQDSMRLVRVRFDDASEIGIRAAEFSGKEWKRIK